MSTELPSYNDVEARNRALWDEIATVHLKADNEVALPREGAEALDEIKLPEVGEVQDKPVH